MHGGERVAVLFQTVAGQMSGTCGIIEFEAFQLRQLRWIRAGLQAVLFQFAREDEAAAVALLFAVKKKKQPVWLLG